MIMDEELKPIDVSKYKVTKTGQVLKKALCRKARIGLDSLSEVGDKLKILDEKLAKAIGDLLYLLKNLNNHEIAKARIINEIEDLLK